ncbi:MAG: class I SAM-dependent methyltransferase [bacterium]|nr:class I SAM-dependent methyltransferase [bacterium]
MQRNNLVNIARSALNPANARIMLGKLWRRIRPQSGHLNSDDNQAWLAKQAVDFAEMAHELNPALWSEAEEFGCALEKRAEGILAGLDHQLGGGAYHQLLYFLTRLRCPGVVVETGVAAGFSSQAFLSAMRRNGGGELHSSDFPYFRLPEPERYIGIVVEEELKENWHLHVKGDAVNLPVIASSVTVVDLFHYDSDKSYSGRTFAMKIMVPRLRPGALIIMDDIQDNSFFHDYVIERSPAAWSVFTCGGKYVGLIGELLP